MSDDSIIIVGGWSDAIYGGALDDVWHSTDMGVTWHQHTTGSPWWARREEHACVRLLGDNIVLTGGIGAGGTPYYKDAWISNDFGETWTQRTADAGWGDVYGRAGHTMVAISNKTYLIAGYSASGYNNDVWKSTDGGGTWTQIS